MSKKLAAKALLVQLPPAPAPAPAGGSGASGSGEGAEHRPKTAPGSMAHFMASQSSAVREAEELRERLKSFDGAQPVRLLDPQTVRASRWANRHEASFADAAFAELKAEIAAAGGNVQPVSVRPVLNGSTPGGAPYELVFGHRRHRACLELGLPLQAMVTDMDDRSLFEAMERENRARKNLSAWEQGAMYKRALDEGLYPSQRKLSEALGVDVALVSKSLSLARLPEAVVAAFPSPLEIQFRWAQPLSEALQKDPEGLMARAKKVRAAAQPLPAAKVLAMLVGAPTSAVLNRSTPPAQVIAQVGGRRAVMFLDSDARLTIQVDPGLLSEAAQTELAELVAKLILAQA